MRLIPVLDVMNGVVVRGVGGRRHEYQPIVSRLTTSTDPVEVARALINAFHPRELYMADLDALGGASPAFEVYRRIRELGISLWVDAGVRDAIAAKQILDVGCDVVAGLETVPRPGELAEIVTAVGSDRVVFSLDLKNGVPIREWPDIRGGEIPILPAAHGQDRNPVPTAVACGTTRLIVLDLARVGVGAGRLETAGSVRCEGGVGRIRAARWTDQYYFRHSYLATCPKVSSTSKWMTSGVS